MIEKRTNTRRLRENETSKNSPDKPGKVRFFGGIGCPRQLYMVLRKQKTILCDWFCFNLSVRTYVHFEISVNKSSQSFVVPILKTSKY